MKNLFDEKMLGDIRTPEQIEADNAGFQELVKHYGADKDNSIITYGDYIAEVEDALEQE